MTEKPKPTAQKIGDVVDVKKSVTLPDDTELHVIKGKFVLDQSGTFLVDGEPVRVS